MLTPSMSDQAMNSAEHALDATKTAAHDTMDTIVRAVDTGIDRVRETSQQVRESTARASESTVSYIRHDPVKSVLIAAATGAALMALVSLLTRTNTTR